MKKLLLIAFALAIPNVYAQTTMVGGAGPKQPVKTPTLTPGQIAQQAKQALENIVQKVKDDVKNFQDVIKLKADSLKTVWGTTLLQPLGFHDLMTTIHTECQEVENNVKDTLENSKESISNEQLIGLLNSLEGYASGRLTGIRLQGVVAQIFDQTKDFYKKIVSTSDIFTTPTKGQYTAGGVMKKPLLGQLAPLFIHKLIVCITAHNLELLNDSNFKNIKPLLSPALPLLSPLGIDTTEGTEENK